MTRTRYFKRLVYKVISDSSFVKTFKNCQTIYSYTNIL